MREKTFEVTKDHLKIIKAMYLNHNHDCEFGAAEVDPKRPYGNSSVYYDIAEILGRFEQSDEWGEFGEEQEAEMHRLHVEATTALQIAISTGKFKTGVYVTTDICERAWKKVKK